MKIGIVDADLIGRSKHRFPNLACMKISGYHKEKGDTVTLITEYLTGNTFQRYYSRYDKIYVSKVFVDTPVPYDILNLSITQYGGTGFFFANADPLIPEIEHHFPDYHLYDNWIQEKKAEGKSNRDFIYYEQYSIGFTSRKCIRQCKFCVNQHSTKVEDGSPISEFLDKTRPYICLLDDNILAYEDWEKVFKELSSTGKMFEYKQGFDIRAINDKKAQVLMDSNFNKNFLYFAFDNIEDRKIIEEKLQLWKQYYKKHINMYILCGFDENSIYDENFWIKNIESTLERIRICIEYGVYPYIMKYRTCNTSPEPFRGMYVNLGSWCNQKSMFTKLSLNEWVDNIQKANEKQLGKQELFSSKRYLLKFAGQFPDIAYKYFDMKFDKDTKEKYAYKKDKEQFINDINSTKTIRHLNEDNKVSKLFKVNRGTFPNGVILNLNETNLISIPKKQISLILMNLRDDTINDIDKNLIIFNQIYLKNNGNVFIFNTNLKSFTLIKEFIEVNTNLKFQEVTTFKTKHSLTNAKYCSRYILKTNFDKEIFEKERYFSRIFLIEHIIKNVTKKDDISISFFERSDYINEANIDNNVQWICLKSKGSRNESITTDFMKKVIIKEDLFISKREDQNIG